MMNAPAARWSRLRKWFALSAAISLNLTAFNNCTGGFKPLDVNLGGQTSAASTDVPGAADTPETPAQPTPAPDQPIVMTNQPAWMAGKNLNEWMEIPNTAGAGGAAIIAFSGMALREATSELIIAAAGGHGDSGDNRVVSLVLAADQPKWVQRIGPSPYPEINVSHYQDGTPSSRHTYQNTYYIESLDRIFLFGARFTFGNAYQFPTVDAFSFKTNQWDPPNTWAPIPDAGGYGSVKVPGVDDVYTNGLSKWSAADATKMFKQGTPNSTSVWSSPIKVRSDAAIRWPLTYDKLRNQLFSLQYGDGQGYDAPKVYASRIDLASGVQTNVTIKPSSAYTQFVAEAPPYAAMDYDPENDRFLFYSGLGEAAGRVYVIKPSSTSNEYEMSLLQTIASSPKPPATMGSGLNSNFKYVPALKGFVLLATPSTNLYFIKTAQ